MQISELVLQGVRNFSQTHRFPLGNGFTVFCGGKHAGKSTLVDIILHLLYPNTAEPATPVFKSPQSDICRVAMTFYDTKGVVYRLVKDLLLGSSALSRYDAPSQKFAPLSKTPAEILQYLTASVHMPHRDVFEAIYTFRPHSFPSKSQPASDHGDPFGQGFEVGMPPVSNAVAPARPTAASASQFEKAPAGFPGFQGNSAMGVDDDVLPEEIQEIQTQIKQLKADLAASRAADEVQFQLDGLQSEMFELEHRTKNIRTAQKKVDELQKQTNSFTKIAELPEDFENKVRIYNQDKQRYARDLARLEEDHKSWQNRSKRYQPKPLVQNKPLMFGLLGGLLALGVGMTGFYYWEWLRWVALLDIPLFFIAMVAIFQHIDEAMGLQRSQERLNALEERREKIERVFELDTSVVRRAMAQAEVQDSEDLLILLQQRQQVASQLHQALHVLEQEKAKANLPQIEQRRVQLQAQIDGLEQNLAGASGMMMTQTEMERRLQQLEFKLAQKQNPQCTDPYSDPFDLGVGAPPGALRKGAKQTRLPPTDPLPPQPENRTLEQGESVCRSLISLAEDLFLVDASQLSTRLSNRVGQFLKALSSNQMTQASFDETGQIEVVSHGISKPLSQISLGDQDLVYLALKFAFVEAFSIQNPLPVLIDDPFDHIASQPIDLLGKVMAGISRSTQVVMLATRTEYAQHANQSYSL